MAKCNQSTPLHFTRLTQQTESGTKFNIGAINAQRIAQF